VSRSLAPHVRWFSLRRWLMSLCLAVTLSACAPAPVRNPIAQWVPSPNFDARRPVLIVIHFTNEQSASQALHTLRTANSGGPVSAHYLVGNDGRIYQLVADSERAWHAGAGHWGTITDVNSGSIGIELDNDGDSPFTQVQIDSLLRLLADLTDRLRIPRTQIIGHEDLAPGRKDDPGPRFPWQQLAQAGFGLWPQGPLVDPPLGFDPWAALGLIGYPLDNRAATVHSFHHHFRGMDASVSGDTLDAQDLRILYALSRQLGAGNGTLVAPSG